MYSLVVFPGWVEGCDVDRCVMYCLGVFPGWDHEGDCVSCIVWVCFQGGLKAAVWTDAFQACVMIVGMVTVIIVVRSSSSGAAFY